MKTYVIVAMAFFTLKAVLSIVFLCINAYPTSIKKKAHDDVLSMLLGAVMVVWGLFIMWK